MDTVRTKNYSGIFLSCVAEDGTIYTPMVKDHTLAYIYSGEMELDNDGKKALLHKGDCFFFPKDHRISTIKRTHKGEEFQGTFLTFPRIFLRDFYATFDKRDIPAAKRKKKSGLVMLSKSPDITSLFESLLPYYHSDTAPSKEIVDLKLREGVYALLQANEDFYPVLFDFTEPWKIDIMGFMNENYMYDLSLEEFAVFTGRSLATFKRDFAKLSDLSPQKWLIERRLEAAYDQLQNAGKKVSDVYEEVGFKNLSHFYAAFKKQYGYSPKK
ncbi:AraC family transcriptional regulator [uncultured Alistipes sp.]|uniref:AraC family transcriptional regulator n=1 Tax=uncultured Alistipes sp. TaxID=538949 RepID=UPI0025CEE546|nr:AraC family transcriptional regulator [uncultured Alistipes sp.]